MKTTRFDQMKAQILTHFDQEQGQRIVTFMNSEYEKLCRAYDDRPNALISHLHSNIFPVVTAFRALLAEGMPRAQAAELAGNTFLELMQAPAAAIRKVLRIPGLYRLMPLMWKTAMPKLFGEDAGFRFRFYPSDRHQVKFDMLACPYYAICTELNCPEIAPVFCASDDICYGHMHPKLIWNRTKTIARGADVCDFDLYIPR